MTTVALRPACNAPFTSMHLDPRGNVRACCMNEYQALGRIGDAGLREIWNGRRTAALRSRLAVGDFSLGCEQCAHAVRSGGAAYLEVFDALVPSDPSPPWPQQLELALTNTCNLQCVMCNGDLSSSIRAQREHRPPLPEVYDDAFFEELSEFLAHARSIVVLGGEPFLGREPMRVFELLLAGGLTPRVHVTTNGTQFTDRVRTIIDAFPIHVAVSLDAISPDLAARIRVGTDLERVLDHVERIRIATAAPDKGCSLAFCMMRQNWHEFGDLLEWAELRDLDVFVNQVSSPPSFSLRHAPIDELERALEHLTAQDRRMTAALGRNLTVWTRELEGIAALVERRRDHDPSSQTGWTSPRGPDLHELSAWSTGALEFDENQIVRTAEGDPRSTGIPFAEMVGRSLQDLVPLLQDHLGPTERSELTLHPDGTEERSLAFTRGGAVTEVRAFLDPDRNHRWELRVRRLAAAAGTARTAEGR